MIVVGPLEIRAIAPFGEVPDACIAMLPLLVVKILTFCALAGCIDNAPVLVYNGLVILVFITAALPFIAVPYMLEYCKAALPKVYVLFTLGTILPAVLTTPVPDGFNTILLFAAGVNVIAAVLVSSGVVTDVGCDAVGAEIDVENVPVVPLTVVAYKLLHLILLLPKLLTLVTLGTMLPTQFIIPVPEAFKLILLFDAGVNDIAAELEISGVDKDVDSVPVVPVIELAYKLAHVSELLPKLSVLLTLGTMLPAQLTIPVPDGFNTRLLLDAGDNVIAPVPDISGVVREVDNVALVPVNALLYTLLRVYVDEPNV